MQKRDDCLRIIIQHVIQRQFLENSSQPLRQGRSTDSYFGSKFMQLDTARYIKIFLLQRDAQDVCLGFRENMGRFNRADSLYFDGKPNFIQFSYKVIDTPAFSYKFRRGLSWCQFYRISYRDLKLH